MDFFGIIYDIKNGKKIPYSKTYFDTLFAAKLEELSVKTITGTLPLTFTTSETALRSWTIYGADIEHVETASGKSITFYTDEDKLRNWTIYGNNTPHNSTETGTLPLTFTTHTAGAADNWVIEGNNSIGKNYANLETGTTVAGITFTFDHTTGTVTANGTATSANAQCRICFNSPSLPNNSTVPPGNYYFSGCPNGGSSSTYDCYSWDNDTDASSKQWDGVTNSVTDNGQGNCQVLINGHSQSIFMRIKPGYTANNVVFKPMLRPADTSPDFEPYQIGVGQRTANIFTETGSEMVQVTSNGAIRFGKSLGKLPGGQYTINADNKSDRNVFLTYRTGDSYEGSNALNTFPVTVTVPDNVDEVFFRTGSSDLTTWSDYGYSKIVIVAGNTAPESFIPYGYEIPLTVSQDGQTDKTVDIFIGENPLTEGETVSKQSTGVDLELFEGENTISTTLYNKPETSITYTDYLGVGEYVNGQWQIPLTVSDGTNTTTVNIPIDAPLTASDTATKTSTGVDIATADGTNTITTSLSNQPDMSITFNEFTGVGIHVGGLFMIALKLVAGGQTLNVFNTTLNKPLRAGETLTSEQTGQTINTVAGVENKLSPSPKAAAYGGNFEMTITYKGG